jgi:hypothetical protein
MLTYLLTTLFFLTTLASTHPHNLDRRQSSSSSSSASSDNSTLPLSLSDDTTQPCPLGYHIITAHGSGQTRNIGGIENLATQLVNLLPGSGQIDLNYPATLDDYISSESQGTGT